MSNILAAVSSIRQPDFIGALAQGQRAGQLQQEYANQNALRDVFAQYGSAAMQGDQNALSQIAQHDPGYAMDMQAGAQDMDIQRQANRREEIGLGYEADRINIARDQVRQQSAARAAEAARQMSADQLAARIAEGQRNGQMVAAALRQGPEAWDRLNDGIPGMADIPYDQAEMAIASIEGALEGFSAFGEATKGPQPLSGQGKFNADLAAGFIQPGTPYNSGGASITNILPNGQPDPNAAFYSKLDEAEGKRFSTILDTAPQVGRVGQQIAELDGLLANVETGGGAAIKAKLGDWGINTEGLDDIQALSAAINQMVPGQRPPGSGTMSDADLALFKQSIPQLIVQPGGNQKIMQTMRAINAYDMEMVRIASEVANRNMTPSEGRDAMRAVANPLEGFKAPPKVEDMPKVKDMNEYNALKPGTVYIAPDGSTRTKG